MDNNRDNITPAASAEQKLAWHNRAMAQGLLCLICKQPPAFEDRHRFYGAGLCGTCLEELHFTDPPPALG